MIQPTTAIEVTRDNIDVINGLTGVVPVYRAGFNTNLTWSRGLYTESQLHYAYRECPDLFVPTTMPVFVTLNQTQTKAYTKGLRKGMPA